MFFSIGLLSMFARSLTISDFYHLYNVLTWIFIGLGLAFFLAAIFEDGKKK